MRLSAGVDGSPAASAAVGVADRLSADLALRLHLVHAYPRLPSTQAFPATVGVTPPPVEEVERGARESGWRLLEGVGRRVRARPLLRLRRGPAADCLERYAELVDAPLIVLGAPRRGALMAAMVGSVAWQLTASCTRPVMLIPDPRS